MMPAGAFFHRGDEPTDAQGCVGECAYIHGLVCWAHMYTGCLLVDWASWRGMMYAPTEGGVCSYIGVG